jgi:putative redox protein
MQMKGELKLKTVEQGLLFEARVGDQRFFLDSGPGVVAPSPVQVVLSALGGCTGMDIISILRKKRQQVTGYEILLEADRSDEHPKVLKRVTLVHRFHGHDLNPAACEEAIHLSATRYCSVHAMLHHSVEIQSRFEIVPAEAPARPA